jgi:FAD/FMN-containing dehydrogenase
MATLGIIGFSGGLTSRAIHPLRTWIDGWNLNASRDIIQGIGDLNGDGRTEVVISSDWGIGVFWHNGSQFRQLLGAARDTRFGGWRYDATINSGRDRIIDIQNFTGLPRKEVMIWSSRGICILEMNEGTFSPNRIYENGTRLGRWLLDTSNNIYCGSGRFDSDSNNDMVLTSPWGIGIISLQRGTDIFMVPTNTMLGSWRFRTESDKIRHIADFDGDGFDEILIEGRSGIAILKLVDGSLQTVVSHNNESSIGGFIVGQPAVYPIADRFSIASQSEILAFNERGLHILSLNGNRLERRVFVANGTRIDGWVLDWQNNTFLKIGDVNGDGTADFIIRSPWGVGIMSAGTDNRFRCRSLHSYGSTLGSWTLESSDIIIGGGNFLGGTRNDILFLKPYGGSATTPIFTDRVFTNWHGNVRRNVQAVIPRNLKELVGSIVEIGSRGGVVGIEGSGWSFTNIVANSRTQFLIDTSELNANLDRLLPSIIDNRIIDSNNRLVHVEAGVKLHELNCRLNALGLALPTMGGSRGQSLAGVISTGVHGADVSLPPVADTVRAIHLVGTGGQQWWIEPSTNPISSKSQIDRAKAQGILDPAIRVVYDDNWFNAVLVSMGCAGVIYSVIVECRPAFRLRSSTIAENWGQAQNRITSLRRASGRPRFLEINVNPSDLSCRVTVRDETTDAVFHPTSSPPPSTCEIIEAAGLIGPGAIATLLGAIGDYIGRVTAEIVALNAIPFGQIEAAKKTAEALRPVQDLHRLISELGLASVHHSDARRVAEILPTAINLIWQIGGFVPSGRILIDQLQSMLTSQSRPEITKIDSSYKIMTDQPECPGDGTQRHDETEKLVESFEYSVSATRAIDFVNSLIAIVADMRRGNDAIVVNFNLRFTGRTRATLGMQQFARTCHVEIYTFRGIRGNPAFHTRMREVVRRFNALPHWGQLHDPIEATAFRDNGALARWQPVIRALANGNEMFWSDFARTRGLLP